jgi:sec-independent protein translocase protein TatC
VAILWRRANKRTSAADGRMTLMEHLTELRTRIVIAFGAIAFFGIIGFALYPHILDWLSDPYRTATAAHVSSCKPHGCNLITTDVLQPFLVRLKIATYVGILLASPVILWEIWRFVTPGLNPKERKYAVPFIVSTVVLFALGAAVAWFVMPKALDFLISIGGSNLNVQSTANAYVNLVGLMFLAFGLSFEFPVLLVFLLLVGVLNTTALRKYRRHAIVGIVAFAAVITPSQDPYSLFLMAVPMYIFYEASIVIGRILHK